MESTLLKSLGRIKFLPTELEILNELLEEAKQNWTLNYEGIEESLLLQKGNNSQKLERLTDAYIESAIE